MKTFKLALTVAALTFFFIACSNSTETNQSSNANLRPSPATSPREVGNQNTGGSNLSAARKLYATNCAACHQDGGEGGVIKLKGLTLKVPSLKAGKAVTDSDEKLTKQIMDGGEGMPAFKDKLKREEVADLVRFIREELQGGVK